MDNDIGLIPQAAVEEYVIPDGSLVGPGDGVEIVPSSEFVTPLSPTKRFGWVLHI